MRVTPVLLCAVGFAVPVAFSAHAEDVLLHPEPETILEIAKGFGSATLDKDNSGDPMVAGRMQGMKYVVYFYGCKDGRNCRSIQFSSGYTDEFPVERANEWNLKYRWIRAYSKEGSNFKMDVDFAGGITKANVEAQFATWESFVSDIKDFVAE
ncbi:MAG TPA: YbjN domain-containing protein [Rhizobiales bacterium]|nr:YbjN domain-containing protein [Hyphomicrobiales bacterium]